MGKDFYGLNFDMDMDFDDEKDQHNAYWEWIWWKMIPMMRTAMNMTLTMMRNTKQPA